MSNHLIVEEWFVHLLNQANLPVSVFKKYHVINAQVAGVITDEKLIKWDFSQKQRLRFFKHLKRWQQLRDHIVSENLWDEIKDKLSSTGICSCQQLKKALCNDSFDVGCNKELLHNSLVIEIKRQKLERCLNWELTK
jgi:hypothetical protein